METIGCYVHIPFCVRKCVYCDFNSYAGYTGETVARYVRALEKEIRSARTASIEAVDTIFFGGGTPTAIPAADEARLLAAVQESLPITVDAEVTTEANPGTMDVRHLEVLRAAGFNRISFGVQSFDPGLLQTLDRIHTAGEAKQAVRAARDAGFENVSLDLMFALPRQTRAQWVDTLDQAFALETDHISLYSLMVEEGTGFHTLYSKGKLPLPDDDLAAEMFQTAIDSAAQAGYRQYEISNFARPGRECRHNLHYWRNEPYFGFGCGAVAYQGGERRTNIKPPARYAAAIEEGLAPTLSVETSIVDQSMAETMMLGLRLTEEGVDCGRFAARYGADPRQYYREAVERLCTRGLLEVHDNRLRLTPTGVFFANDAMVEFV
ncbi:MAG: radical SAM family heme chaperone HemW [Capsulimonadaceae bacterium]